MPDPEPTPTPTPAPDLSKENADLKARIADLESKIPKAEPDLIEKARKAKEQSEGDAAKVKRLEKSIEFNMRSGDFLKSNASVLPKDAEEIFKAADKETYSDQTEKADAIKSSLVQSFFQVQANVDLLTAGQKGMLDEFLKLTKTGKQEKAQEIYSMIFEPAFEMLKRTRKAEALNRGLHVEGTAEEAFRRKIMESSAKRYKMEIK